MISRIALSVKKNEFMKTFKKLVDSNTISKEARKHLKPVEFRPRTMYGSCKVRKSLLIAAYFSDRYFLLYKHFIQACIIFSASFKTINYHQIHNLIPV